MLSSKYLCPVIKKHDAKFQTQIAHPSSPGLATSFPAQYIVNENPFTDHCTLISCTVWLCPFNSHFDATVYTESDLSFVFDSLIVMFLLISCRKTQSQLLELYLRTLWSKRWESLLLLLLLPILLLPLQELFYCWGYCYLKTRRFPAFAFKVTSPQPLSPLSPFLCSTPSLINPSIISSSFHVPHSTPAPITPHNPHCCHCIIFLHTHCCTRLV